MSCKYCYVCFQYTSHSGRLKFAVYWTYSKFHKDVIKLCKYHATWFGCGYGATSKKVFMEEFLKRSL